MDNKNSIGLVKDLDIMALRVRGRLVEMSNNSKAAHLGSALSCVDILVALYFKILNFDQKKLNNLKKDRFILSKGHAAAALYAILAFKGIIDMDLLDTYSLSGSMLEDHPGPRTLPGVEAATGSLGHGLSIGIGIALSDRIQKRDNKTFVLISDGECNEGSVWETAMFASGQKLNNITVIIDFNKWQATGRSQDILGIDPLVDKWQSFGFQTFEIDGHNMQEIVTTLLKTFAVFDRPCAIIAHTVKGKGISFMEDDNNWHYRIPTNQEVIKAKNELGLN
ncbi:transketolase [Desulfobacterales bacterium HSG17]|nr:transketolase [Desulfobacterales bacterium HSG17]